MLPPPPIPVFIPPPADLLCKLGPSTFPLSFRYRAPICVDFFNLVALGPKDFPPPSGGGSGGPAPFPHGAVGGGARTDPSFKGTGGGGGATDAELDLVSIGAGGGSGGVVAAESNLSFNGTGGGGGATTATEPE